MNLMLILQAANTVATTTTETVAKEMNLWEMFQYGGPIMYIWWQCLRWPFIFS